MSVGPDIMSMLAGIGGGGGAPPPPVAPPEPEAPAGGGLNEILDHLRQAIEHLRAAEGLDPDEEDRAKYAKLSADIQACIGKNQADMGQALGGNASVSRVLRKTGSPY